MTKAVFPGSFDPVTMGHVNLIERAAQVFDEVLVAVMDNSMKHALFPAEERVMLLQKATAQLPNVSCMQGSGLTVAFAKQHGASVIIRGVRSVKDYAYEAEIAAVNRHLDAAVETVLFYTDPSYSFVSSSIIREMLKYGQDISQLVPAAVCEAIAQKR